MSQYDFSTIDPNSKSGTQLAIDLNNWRDALHSGHRGAERPGYAAPGMTWIKEVSAERWDLMLYDGTLDHVVVSVNPATGELFPFAQSRVNGLPDALADLSQGLGTLDTAAVKKSGATGAAIMPSGTDAQRPAAPTNGMLRYNSTSNQFEGRQGGVWDRFVRAEEVGQLANDIEDLGNSLQELDSETAFTIIYPNGGSAGSPANVTTNTQYEEDNPFPGHFVLCVAELRNTAGKWYEPRWGFPASTSNNAYGASAGQFDGGSIIVQTGDSGVASDGNKSGGGGGTVGTLTSAPCRVKVWKVKGAIA